MELARTWSTTGSSMRFCRHVSFTPDLHTGSRSTEQTNRSFETGCIIQAGFTPHPQPSQRKVHYETTVPTVSDRIAQTVVQRYLEPILEPVFHTDSYGYRPGRSAHDALAVARQRCWRYDWVLDLDIRSFFDEIDRGLLMRAVRHRTDCAWVLLYIERWLQAPVRMPDGTLESREKGTPQGSVITPLTQKVISNSRG